jgi:hypothetical protein
VSGYLKDGLKGRKPVRPNENYNDKNAKRFKQKESVPQNIVSGIDKLPLDDGTDRKIDEIPKANQPIGAFPYSWYFSNSFQRCKILP